MMERHPDRLAADLGPRGPGHDAPRNAPLADAPLADVPARDARPAADVRARLADLSPEKQALLARRLAERAAARDDVATQRIVPRGEAGPAPLGAAQELLWLHEQMTPGTSAYTLPIARRVVGPLDVAALERALSTLVARHEALRTTFVEIDGAPAQVVADARPVVVELHDLRDRPAATRDAEGAALLHAAAARPIDLAAGTWPRVVVVRLAADAALLLVALHHIACDGASIGILLDELAVAYDAARAGRAASLPPVPIQPADYATWERRAPAAGRDEALAFWRDYLAGATVRVEVPTDRARPGDPAMPVGRVVRVLPPRLLDDVCALGRAHGATPFVVLLTAFQALLARVAGQDDVVVGTPVAGRVRPETQRLVGHLADTLALRARFDGDPTFAAALAAARDRCVRALDHQDVRFEHVARALRLGGADGVFNVAFVLQESGDGIARLGNAELRPYAVHAGAAKFELTLSVVETSDGLRAALEYRRDLFAEATATRMLARFETLLAAAVVRPDTPIAALPLLDAAERAQLDAWAAVVRPFPHDATVASLFDAQAERAPHAVAVVAEDRAMTYAELRAAADDVARALVASGVRRGDRVGLFLDRSERMVVAMLGVLKAGAAYVPLDPAYPAERLRLMAADAGLRVVATARALLPQLPTPSLLPLVLDEPRADAASVATVAPEPGRADDVAYVIYTSGSTGTPKGVQVPHRAITRLVCGADYVALAPDDVVAQVSSCSFDAATFEVWGALLNGARLVVIAREAALAPDAFTEELARRGVTTMFLTTALFNHLARHAPTALAPLRHVLFGGEAVDARVVRDLLARGAPRRLLHVYGPTEVTTFALWQLVRDVPVDATTVPIGQPIANTSAYVLDAGGALAPIGVRGELLLGGPGVATGYLARPELTAERFVPDPFGDAPGGRLYRTGDVVRRAPDGPIEFVGRTDHQVKLRGFRIELGEIEAELARHPGVRDSVVVVRDRVDDDRQLVAYVAGSATPTELRAALRARLPEYMVPAAIVVLDALPINRNGKVDRGALPEPPAAAAAPDDLPPRDDVERVVALVFAEVLGQAPTSVGVDFFDLGGHSLLATRVVTRILKIFRTPLPLRRFFDAPTVAGVARAIVAAEPKAGQSAAVAAMLLKLQCMSPEERQQLRRDTARPDSPSLSS